MEGRVVRLSTALSGSRVRSMSARRHRGTRVVRQAGAALTAGALSLFSGGIIGHALSTSTTTLTSGTNPSLGGQAVVFTATITPVAPAPGGSVTFQDGGINVAGCVNRPVAARVATCRTAALTVGSHTVTAVYGGNATYATSTSAPVTQVVTMGSTTTVVGASVNPSVSGQTVTYKATVRAVAPAAGTRTGTMAFQDGGVIMAGCGAKAVAVAGTATCAIAYAGPGTHTVTAIYSGDANFAASTSSDLIQTVNLGATAIALRSSANPSRTGANVRFTANVRAAAPASGTRTGTVDFQVAGVDITGCSAQVVPASGTATCVTKMLNLGANTITAAYSGDANFSSSTSPALTQTVTQGATTTRVASSLNPSSAGVRVTFTATVAAVAPATGTRTGTVAFEDGGVAIAGCGAQVLGAVGTATCATNGLAAGVHTITAVYSGDGDFITSTSAPLTQTVVGPTTTTVTSDANPSVLGQSIQYTATVAGDPTVTGTITFRDGGANIAGCVAVVMTAGSASCDVSPAVGSHTITAVYSGDASNAKSTSFVLTQVVTADPTTTVLTATVNPTLFGESVTFTATVTANAPGSGTPTGTVAFDDGTAAIAGCGGVTLAAGVATCTTTTLNVGGHSISGIYNGSSNDVPSTSSVLTETVNPASTTTAVGSSTSPSVSGQPVTFTATVSVIAPGSGVPTGTVTFEDGGVTITGCAAQTLSAAVTASCATSFVTAGAHPITAVYSGDANFATSTSPLLTQSVNQGATSTLVTASVDPSVSGQDISYSAIVTALAPASGTPSGTATFMDGATIISGCIAQPLIGGVASCSIAYPGVGSHAVTAVYSGDPDFTGATSPVLTQTVNQGATTTVAAPSVDPSVSGESVSYVAIVTPVAPASGTPTGSVAFLDGASTIAGCATQPLVAGTTSCTVTYADAGTHAITAVFNGDSNFSGATSAPLNQDVALADSTTTVTSPDGTWAAGQAGIFKAIVSPVSPAYVAPAGTAAFLDAGSPIPGCAAKPVVSGTASCGVVFTGTGTHPITAVYSGDAALTGSMSPTLMLSVYDDPPTPDAGANATPSTSLGYVAILGGVLLVFLVGCARLRRTDIDGD